MTKSRLAPHIIEQLTFDEVDEALRTKIVGTEMSVELRVEDGDSVVAHTSIEPRAAFDYIGYNYGTPNTIIKTYRLGGAGGTLVGTVTEVYNTDTPPKLLSQART